MTQLYTRLSAFIRDEEGQAMVEYPLIIALVSLAGIAGLTLMGTNLKAALSTAAAKLNVTTP
ncbi:MAG: Flp family type IVb pilin [Candidatus Sericytochromatia bacterium]